MTKIQMQFDLARPLDEILMERIARLHSVYGVLRIEVGGSGESLVVDYDATRMTPRDLEAVLLRAGLPVKAHAVV